MIAIVTNNSMRVNPGRPAELAVRRDPRIEGKFVTQFFGSETSKRVFNQSLPESRSKQEDCQSPRVTLFFRLGPALSVRDCFERCAHIAPLNPWEKRAQASGGIPGADDDVVRGKRIRQALSGPAGNQPLAACPFVWR